MEKLSPSKNLLETLILGSQSPRRKEILNFFDIPFVQVPPPFDEEALPYSGNPIGYVSELAMGKALSLKDQFYDSTILTADTIVSLDGKIFGKPTNQEEAYAALLELQGNWHSVYTALALCSKGKAYHIYEETRVLFNPLSTEEIRNYLEKIESKDKAGGYAIQQAGGLIVQKISGCYYNVMGLPINSLRKLLLNIGIDLWDFLK